MKSFKTLFGFLYISLSMLYPINGHGALIDELTDGQHIILMRHADAPGFGDPPGYRLDQCSTQRNLGDYGKKQAEFIGKWLGSQGIMSAEVFSSPWCRCQDTARLLNKGNVSVISELGSFFENMSQEKQQTIALQKFIKTKLKHPTKVPIILVTHHVNIEAFTGKVVSVGEMLSVKVDKEGKYISHKSIPTPALSKL